MSYKEVDYSLNNFEALKIGLASTEKILEWSYGEVTKPETINYRSLKPEKEGLFCEKIFGPTKDWECYCGKYKKISHKGIICENCGVEITKSKVRRDRMGHIKLAAPVSHIWYFKGTPTRMGIILDLTAKELERILYFASYVVVDPGDTTLKYKQILNEEEYIQAKEDFGNSFKASMGAEAVKELLKKVDLDALSIELRDSLEGATSQKRINLVKRLEIIESLKASGNRPEWMVLDVVPVIPPELRPMVQLDGGRFATSDLNDLYRRVINRNNRLKRLIEIQAPDIIIRNEKRMLQESVDALIDNGRRGRPVSGPGNRPLKSLSDMLKGKQGRFRQNLLGKRVDYSGRSVIVVGPELKFYQCGLPKKMALELFKPFIMKELVERGISQNIKSAKKVVEQLDDEVWDVLEDIIQERPVMLNRAPTLHRLGIQAFEPVLVEGKAIKLHPLVCTAFNADFDGDQMAVHVPLSLEAQAEARFLMLSVNNILAPKDGSPITTPTQDMILGSYYLTHPGEEDRNTPAEKGDGKIFADLDEMLMAYGNRDIGIHARVKVRLYANEDDKRGKLVESTVGRFIFNQKIEQNLGYVDRSKDKYSLEIDFLCDKDKLEEIIDKAYRALGNTKTAKMLDHIKEMGFHYSTKSAVTMSISDMTIPAAKKVLVDEAEAKIVKYEEAYKKGFMSNEERYNSVIKIWKEVTDDVADALMDSLGSLNNLSIMARSGARGSKNQIKQIGGMRGLMANAAGKTIEIPIKANFREGLSVLEYFISTNGARKGLADTALRTADSGYLTRRLVDVSHNVIIREEDCGSKEGIEVKAFKEGLEEIESLKLRIIGRTSLNNICNPKTGDVIVEANEEITEEAAQLIEDLGIESVVVKSVMTCESEVGVCAKCYGRNLATGDAVNIGEAVGIIAAQSIGEPGTQLTMRTFHTGGVAGSDITHGLPRVEELFEARKPKGLAEICEADGTVKSITQREDNKIEIIIEGEETTEYIIPFASKVIVKEGEYITKGSNITAGPLNPSDILRLKGVDGVYQYLLKEVQKVYKQQGVDINDKHIEVIVRQMLPKVKITEPGDADVLVGSTHSQVSIQKINKELIEKGLRPAEFENILLGITKASLDVESFLSAASFQETTKVLTDAAIKGKVDNLQGLKENVLMGKLIPAGTGVRRYRDVELDYGINAHIIEEYEKQKRLEEEFNESESPYVNDSNSYEENQNVTELTTYDVEVVNGEEEVDIQINTENEEV